LLDAHNLEEQKELYSKVESDLWTAFTRWLIKYPVFMTMIGVPRTQIQLIQSQYPGGIPAYVCDKLRHVFTEVLIKENYFWRLYLNGAYTRGCCPNYLKKKYFETLRENIWRISIYTSSLTQLLKEHPKHYTHFVLLDHQDWLAEHNVEMLEEEWQHILQCSKSGTKILMRSASEQLDFLPAKIHASLRFFPERTSRLHRQDRVGIYGSLHLAEVQ
jgi:S-adenosylmethionine-diacylglycerol 3-amino-3-carboxypropyl transferase